MFLQCFSKNGENSPVSITLKVFPHIDEGRQVKKFCEFRLRDSLSPFFSTTHHTPDHPTYFPPNSKARISSSKGYILYCQEGSLSARYLVYRGTPSPAPGVPFLILPDCGLSRIDQIKIENGSDITQSQNGPDSSLQNQESLPGALRKYPPDRGDINTIVSGRFLMLHC